MPDVLTWNQNRRPPKGLSCHLPIKPGLLMPMTDVVAQTEKRASPLGSIEKQKAPVETTASRPTQSFRLAGLWTRRRLGGHGQKLYFGAKTSLPFSAPPPPRGRPPVPRSMTGLFYVRSTTGAKAAASRQDSVRREEASQESRVILPRRSICSSKTADTSAESRQTELVFFGDKCRPSSLAGGQGGVRAGSVYTYFKI